MPWSSTYKYALKCWMSARSLFDFVFMPVISLSKNSAVTQPPQRVVLIAGEMVGIDSGWDLFESRLILM